MPRFSKLNRGWQRRQARPVESDARRCLLSRFLGPTTSCREHGIECARVVKGKENTGRQGKGKRILYKTLLTQVGHNTTPRFRRDAMRASLVICIILLGCRGTRGAALTCSEPEVALTLVTTLVWASRWELSEVVSVLLRNEAFPGPFARA